jgi:hypothetical protein
MSGQGYNVYKVQYRLGVQDPLMGGEIRYHNVLFVETDTDGGGKIFHVTGDLVSGMRYESKDGKRPDRSETYHAKIYLGRIRIEDYPDRLEQVLRAVPAPHQQRAFNPRTMQTEQIKQDGTFYAPNEQRPPYIKCTEWTEQRAIPALHQYQLLHSNLTQGPLEGASVPGNAAQTTQVANAAGNTASTSWVWDESFRRYRYWNGQSWVWQQ